MSWFVSIGGFLASLWLSYQFFPFRGDESGSVSLSRFVVTGVGTTLAIVVAVQLSRRRTLAATDSGGDEHRSQDRQPQPSGDQGRLPADWSIALANNGFDPSDVVELVGRAYGAGRGAVFPDRKDVFRAFALTPLADVRVVIIGQDPYPTRGEADGLAFSVQRGGSMRRSLRRVLDNIEADPLVHFARPANGDLTRWAQQGVLLLNSALTVREGAAGSDLAIWSRFTRTVLDVVGQKVEPVVFMLWGDHANELVDQVRPPSRHLLLRSTHPRREEASTYPRFADTRPFSTANDFLVGAHRGAVDWSL